MSVKFLVDDEWTEWIETDEDLDLFQDDPDSVRKYALALTNPANAVQYKFTLFGDGKNSPFIKSVDSHFIKSGKMMSIPKLIKGKYASSNTNTSLSNLSNPVGIIDRETWGANDL